jgi:hypothetical protein
MAKFRRPDGRRVSSMSVAVPGLKALQAMYQKKSGHRGSAGSSDSHDSHDSHENASDTSDDGGADDQVHPSAPPSPAWSETTVCRAAAARVT